MNIVDTMAATGYFSCSPANDMDITEVIDLLALRPMDTFLHRHALERLCSFSIKDFISFFRSRGLWDISAISLFAEASLINPDIENALSKNDYRDSSSASPLVDLRSHLIDDRENHDILISILGENIVSHKPLKKTSCSISPVLLSNMDFEKELIREYTHIETIYKDSHEMEHDYPNRYISSAGAASIAASRLKNAGVHVEDEMRHISSLSPIGLMRKWKLDRRVESGRNIYDLSGIHTAYGKGLSLDDARASCIMEVVERYCSYFDIRNGCIDGCIKEYPLVNGSFSVITDALDPSAIRLEIPYMDESLWWMDADQLTDSGYKRIRIPVQMVFLFSNLDEPDLFSGLGSTGLAAHTDMVMAKTAALLECIERDSDTVSVFDPEKCFTVSTTDPELAPLFSAYSSRGISIQFQDIANEMGIPCYRCLVRGKNGIIAKGTGAGLSAKKALLSALIETPYPFPYGDSSERCFENLPDVIIENLPDYSSENPYQDLYVLEKTLTSNGYYPVYTDLTRKDIGLPVVKALIPGMEIMNDFDRFSRISPRMLKNYKKAFA